MKFTSYHWLGSEVFRTVFEAPTLEAAWDEHDQLGPSAYDDRRLLQGDVTVEPRGSKTLND